MINTRSSDLVNNLDEFVFHILGCGAIGSSAALQIARMGATNFCLYDMDKVEEENIGVSQYTYNDLGKPKVDAGRMGAEHYQQYIFDSPTVNKYKKTWYSDEQGSPEPCSAKATSYCSNLSGSFIANTVRKLVTNQPYNKEFSFNFPNMLLEKSVMLS